MQTPPGILNLKTAVPQGLWVGVNTYVEIACQ